MPKSAWLAAAAVSALFLPGGRFDVSDSRPAESDQSDAAPSGWTIPSNGREEKSPLTLTPEVLKKGKGIFDSKCQKCHGPQGKGDGPDGDPEHKPADLTASRNVDGVLFYKIWNGRKDPKMPAFKSELSKDEVWTVVEYAKTLRRTQ